MHHQCYQNIISLFLCQNDILRKLINERLSLLLSDAFICDLLKYKGELMYIAKQSFMGNTTFSIRESYLDKGLYRYRNLMTLGADPGIYIHYPMGRSFYIDESVEEKLSQMIASIDYEELETIFWPYIKADVRRRYEFVRSRDIKAAPDFLDDTEHHIFDKRRFLYLKAGNVNQKKIQSVPARHFRALNKKSRDEIEQDFILMESQLDPNELKTYIYVIFDLQRHFNAIFALEMPQALNQEEVARYFTEDICTLNRDRRLWQGIEMDFFLNDYLERYIIMFFDSEFEKSSFIEDMAFAAFNKKRYYRQHTRPVDELYSEASSIFDVPENQLKKMTKRQLKKLFREKARQYHPDKGGDHDEFVDLSRVYDELMSRMPKTAR